MPCVWIVWIGGVNNTFWWHITNLHIIKSDLLILWIQIWGKNFHALKQSYYIYIYIYIYNFLTRINIFTAIKFGKIASSFSLSMSNLWIFYGVLYVSRVAIVLCPFSPMELRHKIFNRSHLNSKLRLGPVFFHSSPFLYFAYTIYLKRIFWYPGAKIQTTFISR